MKSGWHSVFVIFTRVATDGNESVVEKAFENVEQGSKQTSLSSIILYHMDFYFYFYCISVSNFRENAVIFEHFNWVTAHCFSDCVSCLMAFANNKTSHSMSLKAIALLNICADRLTEVCFLVPSYLKIIHFQHAYGLFATVSRKRTTEQY